MFVRKNHSVTNILHSMSISKLLFLIFLVICSTLMMGYSQVITGGGDDLSCIKKLSPCLAYLKGAPSPAPSCCVPLKEMVVGDSQCLCAVLKNEAILRNLNVTQDDALHLAKTCGANAHLSICTKAAAPSRSPSPNGPKKNAATAACHVGGSVFPAAIIVSLLYFRYVRDL